MRRHCTQYSVSYVVLIIFHNLCSSFFRHDAYLTKCEGNKCSPR